MEPITIRLHAIEARIDEIEQKLNTCSTQVLASTIIDNENSRRKIILEVAVEKNEEITTGQEVHLSKLGLARIEEIEQKLESVLKLSHSNSERITNIEVINVKTGNESEIIESGNSTNQKVIFILAITRL